MIPLESIQFHCSKNIASLLSLRRFSADAQCKPSVSHSNTQQLALDGKDHCFLKRNPRREAKNSRHLIVRRTRMGQYHFGNIAHILDHCVHCTLCNCPRTIWRSVVWRFGNLCTLAPNMPLASSRLITTTRFMDTSLVPSCYSTTRLSNYSISLLDSKWTLYAVKSLQGWNREMSVLHNHLPHYHSANKPLLETVGRLEKWAKEPEAK